MSSSKTRSPNYPRVPLGEAIERAKKLYKAIGQGQATSEEAAKYIGYKGISGPSAAMLSTLKKYGLLDASGEGVKATELLVKLANYPQDSIEWRSAAKEAAETPDLFSELAERFKDAAEPDERAIKIFLTVNRKFKENAAKTAAYAYLETMALVNRGGKEYYADPANAPEIESQKRSARGIMQGLANPGTGKGFEGAFATEQATERLTQRVSKHCKVHYAFEGPVTKEAVAKFIKVLELSKDDYPTEAELEAAHEDSLGKGSDDPFDPN